MPEETPAPVHDRRVQPTGALPKHLQAWLLTGIALAMMVIIAWSTHSAPSRVRVPALAQPVEPNQGRIEEYQRRLDEEVARLQREKQEFDDLHASAQRSHAPATTQARVHATSADNDHTLHADNIAFTRRRDAAPQIAAAPPPPSRTQPPPESRPNANAHDRLHEGTLIEAVLLNRLDGTFAGPVLCTVSVPVYATDTQRILVPSGSRVLGESKPVTTLGQSRLAITFHKLTLPGGRQVSLDNAEALNAIGETGLTGEVDHHYVRMFGTSLALGLLSGFAQYGTRTGVDESATDAYRQSAGSSLAQSATHILDRFTNILPTVTIREGHRVRIYLTHDVPL